MILTSDSIPVRPVSSKGGPVPPSRIESPQREVRPPSAALPQTVILVGNPNVGKSVLFTRLTGQYVVISNFPGTTVEVARGSLAVEERAFALIDTPGLNDLAHSSEDARVTARVIEANPQARLLQVADAKNLRRALILTLQLARLGHPMVLVLNMMDELDSRGGQVDVRRLSELLGIPVLPTIATARTGINLVKRQMIEAPQCVHPELTADLPAPGETSIEKYLSRADEILGQVYRLTKPHHASTAQKLGWWAIHPIKGIALAVLSLYLTFWFVGLLGAGTAVGFMESIVFGRWVNPAAIHAVDRLLPFPHQHTTEIQEYRFELPLSPTHAVPIATSSAPTTTTAYTLAPATPLSGAQPVLRLAHDFLVGEYGLLTMALSYALAIVLPIVTAFFLLFSLLEDSGYLSRLAVMLNRQFRWMGLNGKAVLPMILGLGCDTMATMTTRILETRKERVVTTLLLALAVPCSAQLGVLMAMMASLTWAGSLFWLLLMTGVALSVGWLGSRLYGGPSSDFILELPPMRRPEPGNIVAKTFARLEWYLKEVVPLFMVGTAILFVLDRTGLLARISRWSEPLVQGWLGLPRETAAAFLIGFMRRDFGAVYLLDAATGPNPIMSSHQVLVAMVTITLFMPCIATLFMIARELGNRAALAMTLFIFPFAFFMGGIVHRLGALIGL